MVQTAPHSPLARRTAAFGNKAELIAKIKTLATDDLWIDLLNEGKSWSGISNSKLLRLHSTLSAVKERFGTRARLVEELMKAEGRAKDATYAKHFETWPVARLYDALQSVERRAKRATAAAAKSTK